MIKAKISLKEATKKDYEFLRQTRNAMADVSTFKHHISKKEHLRWCSNIEKFGLKIYVIILSGNRIGYVRINTLHHNEISIALLEEYRNSGYGSQAVALLPAGAYTAAVDTDNVRSAGFFIKNGFSEAGRYVLLKKDIKKTGEEYAP